MVRAWELSRCTYIPGRYPRLYSARPVALSSRQGLILGPNARARGFFFWYTYSMVKKVLHPNHAKVPRNFCRLPDGYGVVKIGVSGAAETGYTGLEAFEKAKELGREIARQGAIITTGATTGFPMYAAMGAKDECGFSVGLSPAATE